MKQTLEEMKKINDEARLNSAERALAFFDAVLAIAITLIVLELPINDLNTHNYAKYHELFLYFTAFLMSFEVLGTIWHAHLRFYSVPAMRRNVQPLHILLLLVPVTLFPKATMLIASPKHSFYAILAYFITSGLLFLGTLLSLRYTSKAVINNQGRDLWRYATHHLNESQLSAEDQERLSVTRERLKEQRRLIGFGEFFTLCEVLSFMVLPILCYLFFILNLIVSFYLISSRHHLRQSC